MVVCATISRSGPRVFAGKTVYLRKISTYFEKYCVLALMGDPYCKQHIIHGLTASRFQSGLKEPGKHLARRNPDDSTIWRCEKDLAKRRGAVVASVCD